MTSRFWAAKHRRARLRRGAALNVIDTVERIQSWMPSWQRLLERLANQAEKQPAASRIDKSLKEQLRHAQPHWGPRDACKLISGLDSAGRKRQKPKVQELTAHALVGEHIDRLTCDLSTVAAEWPSAKRPPATYGDVAAQAKTALSELARAQQHALFLSFFDEADNARVGQRLNFDDHCAGWGLTPTQVDDTWLWLKHDGLKLGDEPLPVVIDTDGRYVYRKARGAWQRAYTNTAALWGGVGALVILGLAFALLNAAGVLSWPTNPWWRGVALFSVVALGATLHVASRAGSGINYDDPLKIYAAADISDWLSLRWLAILRLFIPVAFVTGMLWGTGNLPTDFKSLGAALLAGYTADSLFANALSKLRTQTQAASPTQSASTNGKPSGSAPASSRTTRTSTGNGKGPRGGAPPGGGNGAPESGAPQRDRASARTRAAARERGRTRVVN